MIVAAIDILLIVEPARGVWRAAREVKENLGLNGATKAQKEAFFKKKTIINVLNEKTSKVRVEVHIVDLAAWHLLVTLTRKDSVEQEVE